MTPPTRYTCDEAFSRLDDYLDRELSPEETTLVHEHLQSCEMCAREFEFEASVLHEVRGKLQRIQMPAELRARLLATLANERAAGSEP